MQNMVFLLNDNANLKPSDYDVVMLYEVLLGRNPENSRVIQDHRAQPFSVALRVFLSSAEFREAVLTPLDQGGKVRRHDNTPRASVDQINWLFSRAMFDDAQKAALRQAASWEQFFQYLCSLDGFLGEPGAATPPPAPVRLSIPFKPNARALNAPFPLPAAAAASQNNAAQGDLSGRLDRIEALLLEIMASLRQANTAPAPLLAEVMAAPAGPAGRTKPAALASVHMDAAEPSALVKPRSKRQAR